MVVSELLFPMSDCIVTHNYRTRSAAGDRRESEHPELEERKS